MELAPVAWPTDSSCQNVASLRSYGGLAQEAGRVAVTAETELTAAIERLAQLADQQGVPDVAATLQELAQRVQRHEFRLAVAGQFKRGKSTVINALLGRALLPADVLPLTSVPTIVGQGPENRASVVLQTGATLSIPLEDLPAFATEIHNPGNVRGVEHIAVEIPDRMPVSNLSLIDLPGIGSTVEANSRIAYASLDMADAAILVTGADPPLTEPELRFLETLTRRVARVFVVQNKRDLFSEGDWQRAAAFNADQVAAILGPTTIYGVSARDALAAKRHVDAQHLQASGWVDFESALVGFFRLERQGVWQASLWGKVSSAVHPVLEGLAVREAVLGAPVENLRERLRRVQERAQDVHRLRDDASVLLRRDLGRELQALDRRLAAWAAETRTALNDALPHLATAGAQRRQETPNPLLEAAGDAAARQLADEEAAWRAWWQGRVDAMTKMGDRLARDIRQAYAEEWGVQWTTSTALVLPRPEIALRLSAVDRTSFFPDVSESLLGFMPAGLRRRLVMRKTERQIWEVVDQFQGRVRHAVASAAEVMVSELLTRLRDELGHWEQRLAAVVETTVAEREAAEDARPRMAAELAARQAAWRRGLDDVNTALQPSPTEQGSERLAPPP